MKKTKTDNLLIPRKQVFWMREFETEGSTMADAIMCLATVAFFAVAAVYVRGCKRL